MGMLVLSRKRDESIMIGDDIEIVIVDIRGDKVRIGVQAPKDVAVHRREVYNAIKRSMGIDCAAPGTESSSVLTPIPEME